jgi:hypothetical protein
MPFWGIPQLLEPKLHWGELYSWDAWLNRFKEIQICKFCKSVVHFFSVPDDFWALPTNFGSVQDCPTSNRQWHCEDDKSRGSGGIPHRHLGVWHRALETKSKAGRLTNFSQSKMEDSSDFHGPKKCELLEIIPFSVQWLTCDPKHHPMVKPPKKCWKMTCISLLVFLLSDYHTVTPENQKSKPLQKWGEIHPVDSISETQQLWPATNLISEQAGCVEAKSWPKSPTGTMQEVGAWIMAFHLCTKCRGFNSNAPEKRRVKWMSNV